MIVSKEKTKSLEGSRRGGKLEKAECRMIYDPYKKKIERIKNSKKK